MLHVYMFCSTCIANVDKVFGGGEGGGGGGESMPRNKCPACGDNIS